MGARSASGAGFTFAFQPITDTSVREVFSYEALIRGSGNEPAYQILGQVPPERLIEFDQKARIEAIGLATRLGIGCHLNLNFMPQSLRSPVSILTTLEAADRFHLPIDRIVLEVTEGAVIDDQAHFAEVINEYRGLGLKVAIDDFGAGYSGLNLLADFQSAHSAVGRGCLGRLGGSAAFLKAPRIPSPRRTLCPAAYSHPDHPTRPRITIKVS